MYVVIFLPYKFGFVTSSTTTVWDYFDIMVDCAFGVDIILTFFTPFYEQNKMITSHKKIAINYICSAWFYIDIISIFPFEVALSSDDQGFSDLATLSRIPRLYKVVSPLVV